MDALMHHSQVPTVRHGTQSGRVLPRRATQVLRWQARHRLQAFSDAGHQGAPEGTPPLREGPAPAERADPAQLLDMLVERRASGKAASVAWQLNLCDDAHWRLRWCSTHHARLPLVGCPLEAAQHQATGREAAN